MSKKEQVKWLTPQKVNGVVRQTVPVPSSFERLENDQLDCEMCGSPMTLDKVVRVHKVGKSKRWKARKFSCACGFRITVHGNGERDMCEDP